MVRHPPSQRCSEAGDSLHHISPIKSTPTYMQSGSLIVHTVQRSLSGLFVKPLTVVPTEHRLPAVPTLLTLGTRLI